MKKIFIDGSAGTTGLRIRERLSSRDDLKLVILSEELRKDIKARSEALNEADVAFLCLPDAAAIESASLVSNPDTVIIDTSTAHRVNPAWEYGFAELKGRRERLMSAKRIANPGCHASGFIALVEPLVRTGIIAKDVRLSSFSLTGYSGGGKKMIGEYEVEKCGEASYLGGRQYALTQVHKHLPEMVKICGLDFAPAFSPIVVPHLSGMEVTVSLFNTDIAAIRECYRGEYHENGLVSFAEDPASAENGFMSSAALSGRDRMEVTVYGNSDRALLIARFDNLGKGASGSAIQNMNIAIGCEETKGLVL